jgi:hypothetical protein
MQFIIQAMEQLEKELKAFESEIAHSERRRKMFIQNLETANEEDIKDFKNNTEFRASVAKALHSLERSLKNSAGTFERFSKQVEKDLARVNKHTPNEPLNKRHPFVLKKLDALKRTEQQMGFLAVELEKMADSINWKMMDSSRKSDRIFRASVDQLAENYNLFEAQSFDHLCKRMNFLQQQLNEAFG